MPLLIALVALLFTACLGPGISSDVKTVACSDTALRGEGHGASTEDARNEAYSQIANQIKSSVEFSSKSVKKSTTSDGEEHLESSYIMENATKASILNAEKVNVVYSGKSSQGSIAVVACMERSDAAKPFVELYNTAMDSFLVAGELFSKEDHPLHKADAFTNLDRLYRDMNSYSDMIISLDINKHKYMAERASNKQVRDKALEKYMAFKADFSLIIEEDSTSIDEEVGGKIREVLMNAIQFDGASKSGGVKLTVFAGETTCGSGPFGFTCSVPVTLKLKSLSGEIYWEMTEVVKNTGSLNVDETQKKLLRAIGKDHKSIKKWLDEITKWRSI